MDGKGTGFLREKLKFNPKPNPTKLLFPIRLFVGSVNSMRSNFGSQRKRTANKLKNPRINRISFHTFRHWKATMTYHKTKDILYVKKILGHKSINSTLLYTQLISFEGDEYDIKVAETKKERIAMLEAGFE
jgi:integrase